MPNTTGSGPAFMLRVRGNSMVDAGILDGDYVVVRHQEETFAEVVEAAYRVETDVIAVRARHEVVDHGPYARVRHPIYLGILLLAAGTVCAHPSPATVCVGLGTAAGVALKIPLEERALRRTLGEAYVRYAARVPALLPRLLRRGRP